jgi:hypothetical protein
LAIRFIFVIAAVQSLDIRAKCLSGSAKSLAVQAKSSIIQFFFGIAGVFCWTIQEKCRKGRV